MKTLSVHKLYLHKFFYFQTFSAAQRFKCFTSSRIKKLGNSCELFLIQSLIRKRIAKNIIRSMWHNACNIRTDRRSTLLQQQKFIMLQLYITSIKFFTVQSKDSKNVHLIIRWKRFLCLNGFCWILRTVLCNFCFFESELLFHCKIIKLNIGGCINSSSVN